MLHYELDEVRRESFEAKIAMYKEIILIYLQCLIRYPSVPELRRKLITMMRGFFINLRNEAEIIKVLDKATISQEEFDEALIILDDLFDKAWEYYDGILGDFETAIYWNNPSRVLMQRDRIIPIDDEKKEEILQLILQYENRNNPID